MGRPMMSYLLEEPVVVQVGEKDIAMDSDIIDIPHYEKWSASNAFDPDSDEFWQTQEVVYEAFVEDVSSLEPSSAGSSSDDGREMSEEEREVARRVGIPFVSRPSPPLAEDATSANQVYESFAFPRMVTTPPSDDASRPMEVVFSLDRLAQSLRTREEVQGASDPMARNAPPHRPRSPIVRRGPPAPIPPQMPQTPTTQFAVPSPPPLSMPAVFSRAENQWVRGAHAAATPSSPFHVIGRPPTVRGPHSHRRRESLPASISLRG